MTMWRPPRSVGENTARAVRSMQNGSLDGRVISALPVKRDDSSDFDDEWLDDDEIIGQEDAPSDLLPWTDYFTPEQIQVNSSDSSIRVALTYAPWKQPKMAAETQNRSTVHIYWNSIFQRDLSYELDGKALILADDDLVIRSGDTITVKYWYSPSDSLDGRGASNTLTFDMECWVSSYDSAYTGFGYKLLAAGAISPPPLGANAGLISVGVHRYVDLQALAGWSSQFRLPAGQTIPTTGIDSMDWYFNGDMGADLSIGFTSYFHKGTNYGGVIGKKALCGLSAPCTGSCPPHFAPPGTPTSITPSKGPQGGVNFLSGSAAISFASIVNAVVDGNGNHKAVSVKRKVPKYDDGATYNAGCNGFGVIGFFDDTIYGKHTYEQADYYCKIGVSCVVTLSS